MERPLLVPEVVTVSLLAPEVVTVSLLAPEVVTDSLLAPKVAISAQSAEVNLGTYRLVATVSPRGP